MERINVAQLVKDCPKGMELDCMIYDAVEFIEVDTESDTIILRVGNKFIRRLNKYGQDDNVDCAKCVIFPKGKTTWEGFVPPYHFKDGDVIVDKYGAVAIYKRVHSSYEEPYVDFHCGITSEYRSFFVKDSDSLQHCGKIDSIRLATEEEKQELFKSIEDNGYKWNPEYKTLEKLKKEHPKTPKTYEECCEVIANSKPYAMNEHYTDVNKLLQTLQTLIICRNAYWKIAGEEMGLGKPWEPDWSTSEPKYVLACTCNGTEKQWETTYCKTFAFPTEEMRDTFYENFKDLIEQCKELL